jgi:hypothetical protein
MNYPTRTPTRFDRAIRDRSIAHGEPDYEYRCAEYEDDGIEALSSH